MQMDMDMHLENINAHDKSRGEIMSFYKSAEKLLAENLNIGGKYTFRRHVWYGLKNDILYCAYFDRQSSGFFSINYCMYSLYAPMHYKDGYDMSGPITCFLPSWPRNAGIEYVRDIPFEDPVRDRYTMMKSSLLGRKEIDSACIEILTEFLAPTFLRIRSAMDCFENYNFLILREGQPFLLCTGGCYEQALKCMALHMQKMKENVSPEYAEYCRVIFDELQCNIQNGTVKEYLQQIKQRNILVLEQVLGPVSGWKDCIEKMHTTY